MPFPRRLVMAVGVFASLLGVGRGQNQPDVIVVGAGIAGLSAAYELAAGRANVTVLDMASVYGGHAVMATGDLLLVDTPLQRALGVRDTPDIAFNDFMTWGEDADPEWARYYADHVLTDIYEWVTQMGIGFDLSAKISHPAGNSVLRTHRTKGRGLALVTPIYAACVSSPQVRFEWNMQVDRLLLENKRVVGVAGKNLRTNRPFEMRAAGVVLTTGGFQANLEMVKQNWPKQYPYPDGLLIGAGINALGSGLQLAVAAGAQLRRLDHQWNYVTGIPDPRTPGSRRGLNAYNAYSIWVNTEGVRFISEKTSGKFAMAAMLAQPGQTYWSIFDEGSKRDIFVAGSSWGNFAEIEKWIYGNPDLVKTAPTIEELAAKAGLPAAALLKTVKRHNEMVEKGVDDDFGRFGPGKLLQPKKILTPPFYAMQAFPLTRKSMGGVAIDLACRVLRTDNTPIPGFFAAGEVTGLAGINGSAGLEGTFLGPSIITGRVAGRTILAELKKAREPALLLPVEKARITPDPHASTQLCLSCHDLPKLMQVPRAGFWHFEQVHTEVLAGKMDCMKCHADMTATFQPERHRINRLAQIQVCATCHKGEDR
ncbi:MAG TPA: FAD-dependent oxidoreductase [Opitutaceae bacterium]|nr:FAD-dependent oxidoreductase [Opitutaceae bacterium]